MIPTMAIFSGTGLPPIARLSGSADVAFAVRDDTAHPATCPRIVRLAVRPVANQPLPQPIPVSEPGKQKAPSSIKSRRRR